MGLSSRASDRAEGLRAEIRDIRREIADKKKLGKDTAFLRRELEAVKLKLAAYEREQKAKIKPSSSARWYH